MERLAKGYKSGQLQRLALHFRDAALGRQPGENDLETRAARGSPRQGSIAEECHEQNGHFQGQGDCRCWTARPSGYLFRQMQAYQVTAWCRSRR